MTKRKLNNSLFIHLKSSINQAIPLEYAIRAAKKTNPNEFEKLSKIDRKIRQYWIALGATDAEIDAESLMDFAWDTIQVGFTMTRTHGRLYDPEFHNLIHRGLTHFREAFDTEGCLLNVPAFRYFRICDLLNGNDVSRMVSAYAQCLQDAKDYEAADDIELKKFVLGIREPIHLHPGLQYVAGEFKKGERPVQGFGLLLNTEIEFSMTDLKQQIREFLYQFAALRQSLRPPCTVDHISSELINEFLRDELLGHADSHNVTRLDGFISILSGLYCWDLVQQYQTEKKKSAIDEAIANTLKIYPKNIREVEYEAIRKNYYTARTAISNLKFAPEKK